MITGKVWGRTELLIRTPFIEMHRISIRPNFQCSLHAHQFKWNFFVVLSGHLTIEVHKNDYALVDRTDLGPGEHTTVRPNEYHRFITGPESCEAIEVYYPEPLSEDILRKTVGGTA